MKTDIEQFIKDKHEVNKMLMREISVLVEMMDEAGETWCSGIESGWEYSFKKLDTNEDT